MSAVVSQTFKFRKGTLSAIMVGDSPWFNLAEVCSWLEMSNPSMAKKSLDSDEFRVVSRDDAEFEGLTGGYTSAQRKKINQITAISESGFYRLVMRSNKANDKDHVAYKFSKWVTKEVLPAIRKTGKYSHDTNNLKGPAYNDFTRPRTPAGEVEVYSPPMTIADGVQLMQESFKMFQDKLPDMVATIVNGKGKDSLANQIKRRIKVAVAEQTALLKDRIEELEEQNDDLIDEANSKMEKLKKLNLRMARMEKVIKALQSGDDRTVTKLLALEDDVRSLKRVVAPVKKKKKPATKKGRTIN